jgi:hypothetical protein
MINVGNAIMNLPFTKKILCLRRRLSQFNKDAGEEEEEDLA